MGLKPPFFLQTFIIEMLSNGPPPPTPSHNLSYPVHTISATPGCGKQIPDLKCREKPALVKCDRLLIEYKNVLRLNT